MRGALLLAASSSSNSLIVSSLMYTVSMPGVPKSTSCDCSTSSVYLSSTSPDTFSTLVFSSSRK